jgi:cytochrome c biogenesis protein CcmG/thiol:disulfide interchange protein DsbE
MIRMIPALIFITLAVLLFAALMGQPQQQGTQAGFRGPLTDQPLPSLPLKDAESGETPLKSADLAGRVTVINFLASWCTPCEQEMGELMALKKDLPDADFLGVAWNDSPATITPWLKKNGNPFDKLRYDPGGRAAIALGVRGIPETFILDHHGVVRYQVAGSLTEAMRHDLTPLIKQLEHEAKDAR